MLDIKFIRENPDLVKKGIRDKQMEKTIDIDKLLEIDKQYLALLQKVELHRTLRNQLSENIGKVSAEERQKLIAEASQVKEELVSMEEELRLTKDKLDQLLLWVPNPPAHDVPVGVDETGNVEVKTWGTLPQFGFEPKDHLELALSLNIADVERGTKIAGFRGYFLKNDGVLLHQALLRFALDKMRTKGFDIFEVPWMVKPDYFTGTGYFPWGAEDHYQTQDGLALIGTAEVSLTSYYADEILTEESLPIKLAGVSPCYRREIGSHGKDTKGIFRVHQFSKVEQVVLTVADEEVTREWHDKMLSYSEEVLQELELPYHVLLMCSGDMGAGQRRKYDIETWFPSQQAYRETHSDSYFNDFQARRLNIKYKAKDGKLKFVYTLNNTVAASPRLLAAVLENYQHADGSVAIPQVLSKYLDFDKIELQKASS
jgi:seryl-tRNA synthetase